MFATELHDRIITNCNSTGPIKLGTQQLERYRKDRHDLSGVKLCKKLGSIQSTNVHTFDQKVCATEIFQ